LGGAGCIQPAGCAHGGSRVYALAHTEAVEAFVRALQHIPDEFDTQYLASWGCGYRGSLTVRNVVVATVKQRDFLRIEGGERFFDKLQKCGDLWGQPRRLSIHGEDGKTWWTRPVREHPM